MGMLSWEVAVVHGFVKCSDPHLWNPASISAALAPHPVCAPFARMGGGGSATPGRRRCIRK